MTLQEILKQIPESYVKKYCGIDILYLPEMPFTIIHKNRFLEHCFDNGIIFIHSELTNNYFKIHKIWNDYGTMIMSENDMFAYIQSYRRNKLNTFYEK